MKIPTRKEGSIIPEGFSITDTESAQYLRIKEQDVIHLIRFDKKDFKVTYECNVKR